MTEKTKQTIYEIPAHRLDAFLTIVKRVEKRAAKLGLPSISHRQVSERAVIMVVRNYDDHVLISYVSPEDSDRAVFTEGNVTRRATTLVSIEVTGSEPYLEGHTFVAVLDHEVGSPAIVSVVPNSGVEDGFVAQWINSGPDCDHCHLNRQRNNTYVLRKDDGSFVQVGSTCIKDYFPGNAADDMAALARLLVVIDLAAGGDDDGEWGGGSGVAQGWLREDVLTQAAAVIRERGFTPKSRAENGTPATVTLVMDALEWHGPTKMYPRRPFIPNDDDVEMAEATLMWVDAKNLDGQLNDYLNNLYAACARLVTKPQHMGLVVSGVGSYQRDEAKRVEREVESAKPKVSVVEGRYEFTGKVISRKTQDGQWGTQYKMLVEVEVEGGSYRVWGTEPANIEPEVGDMVRLTATVVRSPRDESFGFYSRPAKASVLESSMKGNE